MWLCGDEVTHNDRMGGVFRLESIDAYVLGFLLVVVMGGDVYGSLLLSGMT